VTVIRSRRAGISAEEARQRPVYAKVLGLQYLRPSSLLCFAFFEGAIVLAALLALAELAQWWVVLILPMSVAAMVKLNDVIAGAVVKAGSSVGAPKALGRATVPLAASHGRARRRSALVGQDGDALAGLAAGDEWRGSPQQRARQSAMRHYE
jgi:predicted secreted protein